MGNFPRHLRHEISNALEHSRVVVLHGARQSGKTTLARSIATEAGGTYLTLDDQETLDAAMADPRAFVRAFRPPLVIDEIQIAGQRLVAAVKIAVDEDDTPGRYLLTGSTNFLTVPTIAESLAGRVALLRLWPLSQAELAGCGARHTPDDLPGPVGLWFAGRSSPPAQDRTGRDDYLEMICAGGYPEALRLGPRARRRWFDDYVETVIGRDIVALGDIRRAGLVAKLLRLAAANTAGEVNVSDWARFLGADRATVESYLGWLRTVFLIHDLSAWTRNRSARVVRRAKLHLADSGLAAALCDVDAAALRPPTATVTGRLLETFVVGEIARRLSAGGPRVTLHHYRDNSRHEVDLVLERADGAVVAVEVKATSSPLASDLRHLAHLRDRLDAAEPGAFRAGVLLHTGGGAFPMGDRLQTAPIHTLWTDQTQP